MRIISGTYRHRKLKCPLDDRIRPTQDRVKEAWFNIIGSQCIGATVLDLCCGTGSLGIEALSRGASSVTFVDKYTGIVTENLVALGILSPGGQSPHSAATVIQKDAIRFLSQYTQKSDIILVDPPWDDLQLASAILAMIANRQLLNDAGIVYCEHRRGTMPTIPPTLSVIRSVHCGKSGLCMAKISPSKIH